MIKKIFALLIPIFFIECSPVPHGSVVQRRIDPPINEDPVKTVDRFGKELGITLDCGSKDCAKDYASSMHSLSHHYSEFGRMKGRVSLITFEDSTISGPVLDGLEKKLYLPTLVANASVLKPFFQAFFAMKKVESKISGTHGTVQISFGLAPFTPTNTATVLNILTLNAGKIAASSSKLAWILIGPGEFSCSAGVWSVSADDLQKNFNSAFAVVANCR